MSDWYKAHAHAVIDSIVLPAHSDVLDIGCGTGYLLRNLLRNREDVRALGLDISSSMITEATSRAANENTQNLSFRAANFEHLDDSILSDYRFQCIFCINTFHYFAEPLVTLRKIHGLLSANGSLYILERDKSGSVLTRLWALLHRYVILDHVRFASKKQLMADCRRIGFDRIDELFTVKRFFWKHKAYTSIVFIHCKKPMK